MAKITGRIVKVGLLSTLLVSIGSAWAQQDPKVALNQSVDHQEKIDRSSETAQEKINEYSDQTSSILQEYRLVIRQIESLKVYNDQMQKVVDSQQEEIDSLQFQLDHLEDTKREIVPLMRLMIEKLETFVEIDTPFLPEERTNRVQMLKEMMDSSQYTTSEKYRRILEAYQIEMDFGRNLEVYEGTVEINGEQRTVNFLRFGRIALYYQTLDRNETGWWNKESGSWETLPDDYKLPVAKAMQVARKQAAPALLRLPLPKAENIQK